MQLCLWIVAVPASHAEEFDAYGRDFARHNPAAEMAGAEGSGTTRLDREQVELLESRLRDAELEEGPYAGVLSEPLGELARAYVAAGDAEEALALYSRALHIVRVNDGLYSAAQAPLVRAILDLYRREGQLEALDERYDYFFRLYGSGQPPYTEVRLRATLEYLRWQREAYARQLGADPLGRLLDAQSLNEDLLEGLVLARNVPWNWRHELAMSQLQNFYLLQTEIAPRLRRFQQTSQLRSSTNMPVAGSLQPPDYEDQRLLATARGLPGKARLLFEQTLSQAASQGPGTVADWRLEYGDWHLWNGNLRLARTQYQFAEQTFEQAGGPALVAEKLGQPVELPANGAFLWDWKGSADELATFTALLSVDARGRARVSEVRARREQDRGTASRLSRGLGDIVFRPIIRNGEPVASELLELEYDWLR